MQISTLIRRAHRWIAIAFTLGFLLNSVVIMMSEGQPPGWIYLFAIVPLFLLFFSGLYMLVMPNNLQTPSMRAETL